MELNQQERKIFINYLLNKNTLYEREMKFFVQSFYQYSMNEKKPLLIKMLTKFNHTRLSQILVKFFYQAREKEKLSTLKLIVDENLIGSNIEDYLMFFEEESHKHAVKFINSNPAYKKLYLTLLEVRQKKIKKEIKNKIKRGLEQKRKKIEREIKIAMEQKTIEERSIERNQQKKELEYGEYADREREKEIEIQQIAIEEKETMKKRFFYN